MTSLPPRILFPVLCAIGALVVLVITFILVWAMREQKIRHQRLVRLSLGRQRQFDEDGNQIEQEKPEIWEVVLDEHKPEEVWDERLEPISLLPLSYPPNTRILPSLAPPLLLSVLIAHPRPHRPQRPSRLQSRTPSRANLVTLGTQPNPNAYWEEEEEEEEEIEQVEDVEIGSRVCLVKGDWRIVTGQKSLGFLD